MGFSCCVVVYIIVFAVGMGPIPWLILTEIFTVEIRGAAMSISIATNWITNAVISLLFLQLVQWMTISGVFFMFAGISVLGFLFIFFFVPETRNKSVTEVLGMIN
jgi:MFS family permease